MGKIETPGKLTLGMHRVSYLHIKQPNAFEPGQDPKYDATFLIAKDHPDVQRISEVIEAAYRADGGKCFGNLPFNSPRLWYPLRDGDEWLEDHPEALEYEGHYFLKASSKSQPPVFDQDGQEILDLDREVYSGMYARAVIGVYTFDNKSKGFGFFLNSLKKIQDGERLGGFTATHDDYEDDQPTPRGNAPVRPSAPVTSSRPGQTTPVAPAARPGKPVAPVINRIWEADNAGVDIYSDDNGTNWFYP